MKRNDSINVSYFVDNQDLLRQIAFHEAGHAAAISLRNQQKHLPPVYFQITIGRSGNCNGLATSDILASVDNGLLISNPAITMLNSDACLSSSDRNAYRAAFEADIVNLMVGPLAEAKYVALRDGEHFSRRLINPNALKHYGGSSDLEHVQEYLNAYVADGNRHPEKLEELFALAFQFIDSADNWRAISRLAAYLIKHPDQVTPCETVFALLNDSPVTHSNRCQ